MALKRILKSLSDAGVYPSNASKRYKKLDAFERILEGTIYDKLRYEFSEEANNQQYIPIAERAPSVKYNLARIVVDQTAALTFGEAHFPHVRCQEFGGTNAGKQTKRAEGDDQPQPTKKEVQFRATEVVIGKLIESCDLISVLMDAIFRGSIGSCAIIVRELPEPEFGAVFDIVSGKTCRPILDIRNPRSLLGVARTYSTTAEELEPFGYENLEKDKTYWMHIELDAAEERWFLPLVQDKYEKLGEKDVTGKKIRWVLDKERTEKHAWGVVPAVWVRNLTNGRGVDGVCTFESIVDMQIENDYLLSQVGRGFKYAMDPLLVKKKGELESLDFGTGGSGNGNIVKSPSKVLETDPGGDYKLLEITGNGLKEAREHIKMIREYALEVLGGMKADQAHSGANQSGRALELLHQALVWLVERLRITYGNHGLTPLLRILLRGVKQGIVRLADVDKKNVLVEAPIRLQWPSWWVPRGSDLRDQISALQLAAGGSEKAPVKLLPIATVSQLTSQVLDLSDPNAEFEGILHQEPTQNENLTDAQIELTKAQTHLALNPPKPTAATTK